MNAPQMRHTKSQARIPRIGCASETGCASLARRVGVGLSLQRAWHADIHAELVGLLADDELEIGHRQLGAALAGARAAPMIATGANARATFAKFI